jgi:hypothetical protein
MPFAGTATNYMLNEMAAAGTWASLHTAFSSSGANELPSSPYGRVGLAWAAAGGGTVSLASQPAAFSVAGTTTVEYVGFWNASAVGGGTFWAMGAVGGGPLYEFTAGTYLVNGNYFTIPSASFSLNQAVVLFPSAGGVLPTNITEGAIYYISATPTGDNYNISTTSGGGSVTPASNGAGIIQTINPETFGSPGTLQLTTLTSLTLT